MNLYSMGVTIHATVYVKANSPEEAMQNARCVQNACIEVKPGGGDVEISGLEFTDPDLPLVSLSPAMTVGDVETKLTYVELQEENI